MTADNRQEFEVRMLAALTRLTGHLVTRLVKAVLLAAILAGIPYGLATQIGSPLPRTLPSLDTVLDALTEPVSDALVLDVLAVAAWILWATFTLSLVVEVAAAVRGVPAPRVRLLGPTQALAGWLLAGLLAAAPVAAAVTTATQVVATAPAGPVGVPAATAVYDATVRPAVLTSTSTRAAHLNTSTAAGRPVYEVARGDWMVAVAQRFLGDENRYPDIAALNPRYEHQDHRFPDHWEATWKIVLPDDARDRGPRPHATGHLIAGAPPASTPPGGTDNGPSPGPGTPPSAPGPATTAPPASPTAPSGSPTAPSTPARDPDGVVTEPSHRPPTPTAAPAATSHTPASPSPDPPAGSSPDRGDGVSLPGGWVTLPLAGALVAAAAMVWLRRRHRYIPQPLSAGTADDPDLQPLPPVITRLRRAVRQHAPDTQQAVPRQPTVAEYTDHDDPDRPDLPPIGPTGLDLAGVSDRVPAGGLGLVGPGAPDAARALLVATLSAGGPDDPDARGQVVIPADALTTLLGAHAVDAGPMPRLIVTATLSEALTRVEELLIERRRLLEEYETNDLAGMRAADPYHPPMPPVLLLAETPEPQLRARLTTSLHLGTPLQISAVLLGQWPRGDTLTVQPDGHATGGDTPRLAVLDLPTTLQLLQVLREAHTGQPASTAPVETSPETAPAAPPATDPDADTAPAEPAPGAADGGELAPTPVDQSTHQGTDPAPITAAATPADPAADGRVDPAETAPPPAEAGADTAAAGSQRPRRRPVRIRLLGTPTIVDRDGQPVPGLRHHARELLVYLAGHRGGTDLSNIMEAFWPTATVRRAGERLSTEAGDLRRRIRQAAADPDIQPVVNTGGRYHLDPNLLDIDLWGFLDALRHAAAATDPAAQISALRRAVDAHTGTLADGHDYDWIEQPREQLRRHGIRARLQLADLLADTDPRQAADLTQAAADLDPYNEDLTRQAMRAFARLGDAAAVRAQLQRLRDALDDIDEEPSADTIALAAQLHRRISGAGGRQDSERGPDATPPAEQ